VSLLMDALKKAEEAKRRAQTAPGSSDDGQQRQPRLGAQQSTALPALPDELSLLDDEFSDISRPRSQRKPATTETEGEVQKEAQQDARQAAQNLFAAKSSPSKTSFYLTLGGATLLAILGIGVYFWWQLQPAGVALNPAANLKTAPPLTASPALSYVPQLATPQTAAPPAWPADATLGDAKTAPGDSGKSGAATPTAIFSRSRHSSANDTPNSAKLSNDPVAGSEPAVPIRITTARAGINPGVNAAYQAFLTGDLKAARNHYEQVLKTEPKNSDALHGLAVISLNEGNGAVAENYYSRALEANPRDAQAHAALLNLKGHADPQQAESRLKTLLAAQPDNAAIHFTLGNLYARQGRWGEAQQAYFRAYTGEANNPDYAFNLAVSLDQLHQPRLAAQYYQNALSAAATRQAAFDKPRAAARIRDLQQ